MPHLTIDVRQRARYRIFAGQGNVNSEEGVTVIAQVFDEMELTFEFWTRDDAFGFFNSLAKAAAECPVQEAGEQGTIMAEGVMG